MISNDRFHRAEDFISALAAKGRHHFTTEEARRALGTSAAAVRLALGRLQKRQLTAAPVRGFHVIVPPEYASLGCLPADQFIPALMAKNNLPYYAGLLSAAQYHGAAHHRPQQFQVMVEKPRRAIACGKVRVAFFVRRRAVQVPAQGFNTPRGTIRVATPEATAFDLVGYARQAGGLDQVATVLAELARRIDPERLVETASHAPVPWAQRLGYLLEAVEASQTARPLKRHVQTAAREYVPLRPGKKATGAKQRDWRLILNAHPHPDT